MLVGTCEEPHALARQTVIASQQVARDDLVRVPDVGHVVDVIDRARDVEAVPHGPAILGAAAERAGPSGIVRPVKRRLDPGLFLLLTPVLWGASFPATKIVLRHVAVLPFMFWTRTLGFVTILAWVPFARGPSATRDEVRRALLPGAVLGALMVVGFSLQTAGIARTTATNAGFITGLYVVLTPLLGAVAFQHTVARSAWFAVALSVVGLALLSVADLGHVRLHAGDLLVLAGAVAWAGHITAVGHFSPRHPARVLALAQMGCAAVLHLVLAAPGGLESGHVAAASVWPLLIVTGVLGSGVAFTIQVVAQ